MKLRRVDHIGINFDDLPAAVAFFEGLGLKALGDVAMQGKWLSDIVGLEGVKTELVMMATADGGSKPGADQVP